MDLISSIRKEGSRGGVNFSWSDVTTSQHRENYLGHSIMAPVGRWQKGKDLTWYAKGDHAAGIDGESAEERKVRERKEEIQRIKEAEEDALAKALGLPVKERNVTGSNRITVAEVDRAVKEAAVGEDNEAGSGNAFGDFVGMIKDTQVDIEPIKEELGGGLAQKDRERRGRSRSPGRERKNRRHRRRSRSGERRRPRSRSGDRYQRHRRDAYRDERRPRSRDVDRARRRQRSRSPDSYRGRLKRSDYDDCRERSRRSISLDSRDRRRRRNDGEWR